MLDGLRGYRAAGEAVVFEAKQGLGGGARYVISFEEGDEPPHLVAIAAIRPWLRRIGRLRLLPPCFHEAAEGQLGGGGRRERHAFMWGVSVPERHGKGHWRGEALCLRIRREVSGSVALADSESIPKCHGEGVEQHRAALRVNLGDPFGEQEAVNEGTEGCFKVLSLGETVGGCCEPLRCLLPGNLAHLGNGPCPGHRVELGGKVTLSRPCCPGPIEIAGKGVRVSVGQVYRGGTAEGLPYSLKIGRGGGLADLRFAGVAGAEAASYRGHRRGDLDECAAASPWDRQR